MAASGPDKANEWKSDATADRVEDAWPSSAPCHLHQYWRAAKTCYSSAGSEKRRERERREQSLPSPTLSPSMALKGKKRLRAEKRAQGNCKLALCVFAQGLTGDKSLDRRESLVIFLPFFWWLEFNYGAKPIFRFWDCVFRALLAKT